MHIKYYSDVMSLHYPFFINIRKVKTIPMLTGNIFSHICKYHIRTGFLTFLRLCLIEFESEMMSFLYIKISKYLRRSYKYLVAVNSHGPISLIISSTSTIWAVHRYLCEISSQSVAMCIIVREKSSLKHLVWWWLNARDQVSRRKGQLLHLHKMKKRIKVTICGWLWNFSTSNKFQIKELLIIFG